MMDSKRIAKNTLFMSVRMFATMAISLYTSRIVLEILGINDYGIYSIVGGVVIVLGFLSGTMSTSSSRFITVALGSGELKEMKQAFSSIFFVNVLLSLAILFIGETAGLWFLYNKIQIPSGRFNVALWVYQISLATMVLNIVSVPYNAVIIAHEKMKAFAYMSLFDVLSKLLLVVILHYIDNYDKLLLYAVTIFVVQVLDRFIYGYYCSRSFKESCFPLNFTKEKVIQIFYFITWSAYGSLVSVGFTQGLNILLNVFFGTIANAARAIAVQVQNAILQFTTSFQTAINPQIIKSFVNNDFNSTRNLMITSSKLSFFILCMIGLPIVIEADTVLIIWLKDVPEYTVHFVQMIIMISIWSSLANPLRIINQADGNIRKFQIYECTLLLLIVPISYICVRQTNIPESVFVVHFFTELVAQIIRIWIVLPKINMKIIDYIKKIYLRIIPVFVVPIIGGEVLNRSINASTISTLYVFFLTEILVFVMIYIIGISDAERSILKNVIINKLNIIKKAYELRFSNSSNI